MTAYVNRNQGANIRRLEFAPSAEGNWAFLTVSNEAAVGEVKQWLAQPSVGRKVVGETHLGGKHVLVTSGTGAPEGLLQKLQERGEQFSVSKQKSLPDPWVVRSFLGIGGQTLQLASSFMRPAVAGKGFWGKVDTGTMMFAASNLTANGINLVYKAQNVDDPHQLRYLKQQINDRLSPSLTDGQMAPSPDDNRLQARGDIQTKDMGGAWHNFMQRHSVNIGELGLRYLGAFGLVSPAKNWGGAFKQGKLPPLDPSSMRWKAGVGSILGKTVALSSTIPDPYNPETQGPLKTLRSQYSFITGGLIEAASFGALAIDCYHTGKDTRQPTRGVMIGGQQRRDWLGVAGASMFVLGYIIRLWADYGKRHVDMRELYAHTSDTLAKLPLEKQGQALADTAAQLADHFKNEKNIDYSTIYSNLSRDLGRYQKQGQGTVMVAGNAPDTQVADAVLAGRLKHEDKALSKAL